MRTAAGKAFLDMLGVFAEFESNLRKERQAEGIAAAKARGVDKRRKSKIDAMTVRKLRYREKLGPADIARRRGIGRAEAADPPGGCRAPQDADYTIGMVPPSST